MPYYTQLRTAKADFKRYTDKYKKVGILDLIDMVHRRDAFAASG